MGNIDFKSFYFWWGIMKKLWVLIVALAFSGGLSTAPVFGKIVSSRFTLKGREDIIETFQGQGVPAFSFRYDGIDSGEFLGSWERIPGKRNRHEAEISQRITFREPLGGLEIDADIIEYTDAHAVEWVLSLTNRAESDSPLLEDIQALDWLVTGNPDNMLLHYLTGNVATINDFAPVIRTFPNHEDIVLAPVGGRSSNGGYTGDGCRGAMPFFVLDRGGEGVILAVGWTGQWSTCFQRDADSLRVSAGMELTHLKLHSGESIRTPKILAYFWEGELESAQNDFRQFLLAHYTPHLNGEPVTLPISANSWFIHGSGNGVTEENQLEFINRYTEKNLRLDSYWIDAGWYGGIGNWAWDVGNWFPKKSAFPNGLRPVADRAHELGMTFILWFEPERVHPGTWLYENHPEWLLYPTEEMNRKRLPMINEVNRKKEKVEGLLNLGNPEARHWLTNHVSSMVESEGIDIYRQDFNFDPLDYWRAADEPDRQGITEIRHIEGLYAFWDELRERHPGLVIDNCASGGKRIDLETIARSVALWRTDYYNVPEAVQCHTMGINTLIPVTAGWSGSTDSYDYRSCLTAGMALGWDPTAADFDSNEARKRLEESRLIRPLFYGDFYPLTQYDTAADVWCAYQLNRPDLRQGAVLVFRRKASPYLSARFRLRHLQDDVTYALRNIDTGTVLTLTGKQLMEEGIEVDLSDAPSSYILHYTW